MSNIIQICDCTLRDGGYYTNWDFNKSLVQSYFRAMAEIPAITHIEIGYRSKASGQYLGEYFYCPNHVLKMAKELCANKELAIMLNERDTKVEDLDELLDPCKPYIQLVRMAVDPKNLDSAAKLAVEIKAKGFKVGFNLMYMSQWASDLEFIKSLKSLESCIDYIYMVDSFGSVYPNDVKTALEAICETIDIPVGFHGHNNLELGLANSLIALENGCQVIDATITGMGRGAGNLKTELLLTSLNAQDKVQFDFNKLNPIVAEFEEMQQQYKWGTNLPYMISGAYSLQQKEVMSWISKKRFTTESIINALQNKKNKQLDNYEIPVLANEPSSINAIIIGGGENTKKHLHALESFCQQHPESVIIHAGVRYVDVLNKLPNKQYYCLLGSEGNKLQKRLSTLKLDNVKCILEPSPRVMGTILPEAIQNITHELPKVNFIENYPDSLLTIAFQLSLELKAENVMLFGLDGYDVKSNEQMIEVSSENQYIIDSFLKGDTNLTSATPTNYKNITTQSIYSYI